MKHMSKVCDAADWFQPDLTEIITNELREVPRFHRKQWEFASIFLALRQLGKLHPDARGLSMGGGRELLLYALASHVKELVVTDLYSPETIWDCAKTENPDAFIKFNKPLPVDDSKIRALRMDMRDLDFPDDTFDFCYSTCAVEHIGEHADFLRHLNEVARVLKEDGVYVMTTEVNYGDSVITDEHNYVFSLPYLNTLFAGSGLTPEMEFDARISAHKINFPYPSNLKNLSCLTPDQIGEHYLCEAPHLHLLRGDTPFTAGIFLLTKSTKSNPGKTMHLIGRTETQGFMQDGVENYRQLLAGSRVGIHPFSWLNGEGSRVFADHAEFFNRDGKIDGDPETVFHTDYFWWGKGRRAFTVECTPRDDAPDANVELRVHRYKTLASRQIECVHEQLLRTSGTGRLSGTFEIDTDDDSCYAVLAKLRSGTCAFEAISVQSEPAGMVNRHVRMRARTGGRENNTSRLFKDLWTQ